MTSPAEICKAKHEAVKEWWATRDPDRKQIACGTPGWCPACCRDGANDVAPEDAKADMMQFMETSIKPSYERGLKEDSDVRKT